MDVKKYIDFRDFKSKVDHAVTVSSTNWLQPVQNFFNDLSIFGWQPFDFMFTSTEEHLDLMKVEARKRLEPLKMQVFREENDASIWGTDQDWDFSQKKLNYLQATYNAIENLSTKDMQEAKGSSIFHRKYNTFVDTDKYLTMGK